MLLPEEAIEPPFTDDDLEAYFQWAEEPHDEEPGWPAHLTPVAGWSVCDTGSAEWAMRRLAHAEATIDEIIAQAEEFKAQIDRWATGQLRPHQRAANFFGGQLEGYARRLREEEGRKTLKLPSGEVRSRLNPARPEVVKEDRDTLIAWARDWELPLVKATWSPVMDEIKKAVVFRTVIFPNDGDLRLQVHDVDDHLIVLPESIPEHQIESILANLKVANLVGYTFHERPDTAIYRREDGTWWLVPGVALVPEEVTYTVKPSRP